MGINHLSGGLERTLIPVMLKQWYFCFVLLCFQIKTLCIPIIDDVANAILVQVFANAPKSHVKFAVNVLHIGIDKVLSQCKNQFLKLKLPSHALKHRILLLFRLLRMCHRILQLRSALFNQHIQILLMSFKPANKLIHKNKQQYSCYQYICQSLICLKLNIGLFIQSEQSENITQK